jgi:hypothetical protein
MMRDESLAALMERKSFAVTGLLSGLVDWLGVPRGDVKITSTVPDLLGGRRLAHDPAHKPPPSSPLTVNFDVTGDLASLSALLDPVAAGDMAAVMLTIAAFNAAFERIGFGVKVDSVVVTVFYPSDALPAEPEPLIVANASNATNGSNASRRLAALGRRFAGAGQRRLGLKEATLATIEPELSGDSVAVSIDVDTLFGENPSAVLSICYGLEKVGSLRFASVVREKWIIGSQEWTGIEVTSNPATYLKDRGPGKIVLVAPEAQCGYDPACYPAPSGVEVLDPIFNCSASEKIYFPIYAEHAQTLKVCFCLGGRCTRKEDATLEIGHSPSKRQLFCQRVKTDFENPNGGRKS